MLQCSVFVDAKLQRCLLDASAAAAWFSVPPQAFTILQMWLSVARVLFQIFGFPEEMNCKKDFFTKSDRLYDGRCDGKFSSKSSDLISVSLEYCFRLVLLSIVQVGSDSRYSSLLAFPHIRISCNIIGR